MILAFGASLRKGSYNKQFARAAAKILDSELKTPTEYVDFRDFAVPVYDGDLEDESGVPKGAVDLGAKIRAASALVISTPEYNGSIPGVFKNMIDWLSREDEVSLEKKPILLLAASPGALGGVRSLWHSRQPLEVLGAFVYPGGYGLGKADAAFDEKGDLKDPAVKKRVLGLLTSYVEYMTKLQSSR